MILVSFLSVWYFGDFGTLFFWGAPKKTRLVVSNIFVFTLGKRFNLTCAYFFKWVSWTPPTKTPEFSSFVFASRLRRKNLSLMRRYRHQEWIIGKKWLLLSLNPLKLWPVVSRDLCSFEHRGHFSEEPVKWQGHERESMILVYLLSVWYFGIFLGIEWSDCSTAGFKEGFEK